MTSHKTTAIFIGIMFLGAMFTYGLGFGIIESLLTPPDFLAHVFENNILFLSGAILMMMNSCIVVGIGVFMYPILKQYNKSISVVYLGSRVIESLLLLGGVISLLFILDIGQQYLGSTDTTNLQSLSDTYIRTNYLAYQSAMIVLGFGSMLFCAILYKHILIAKPLAILGFVGYAFLLLGAVLELLGYPYGLMFSIPGGLFEVILPFWLFSRGLNIEKRT